MDKYLSKKEYLNKYDSNVGYALYVQDNIEKDDYVKLNTGEIVRVIGIKENKLNKKAIYYGVYEQDWLDSTAVENFSKNIIDLIEDEDFVVLEYKSPKYRERITRIFEVSKIDNFISFENQHCNFRCKVGDKKIVDKICKNIKIKSIVTKEEFEKVEYKI